ncbi:hypothetical protein MPTK1_1g02930 [Marchantia polymorpha subsp. ruderalis]|uniref:Uncharacterized protein n=2 Tax=Marchantia polymorpha TaxID=3197 RepID=A0AAF6AKW8_MARPO|nr:hypothetical protein MARPO_0113s0042 [Marchantia polymorpha]BBM97088.1 hypothetical protein Mp_1g02930 [Marchantia polymorpha subsp. ruderalis]|eukprot:PTQ31312.1 hypothetical protein MARPO_0113s0042 [Marchantia polymorpha]
MQTNPDPLTSAMVSKRDPLSASAAEVNKPVDEVQAATAPSSADRSKASVTEPSGGSRAENATTAEDESDILFIRRSVLGADTPLE